MSVNWTFLLGVTAEALRAKLIENRRFRRNGISLAQNFRYKASLPPTIFFCQKTKWMGLLHGLRISAEVSLSWSEFTRLTDEWTDGNIVANTNLHSMQSSKNSKLNTICALSAILYMTRSVFGPFHPFRGPQDEFQQKTRIVWWRSRNRFTFAIYCV